MSFSKYISWCILDISIVILFNISSMYTPLSFHIIYLTDPDLLLRNVIFVNFAYDDLRSFSILMCWNCNCIIQFSE
jgi:hypothetical protein